MFPFFLFMFVCLCLSLSVYVTVCVCVCARKYPVDSNITVAGDRNAGQGGRSVKPTYFSIPCEMISKLRAKFAKFVFASDLSLRLKVDGK